MNTKKPWPAKDPQDRLDYMMDFAEQLEADGGDTLTGTPTVQATPAGLEVSSISIADVAVGFWLAGGEADRNYQITVEVQTNGGRTYSRSEDLRVRKR